MRVNLQEYYWLSTRCSATFGRPSLIIGSCRLKKEHARETSAKVLVRWATGTRLTNRLPKPGLVTLSLERRDTQVQTGYTVRRVNNSQFQFKGAQGEYTYLPV